MLDYLKRFRKAKRRLLGGGNEDINSFTGPAEEREEGDRSVDPTGFESFSRLEISRDPSILMLRNDLSSVRSEENILMR